MKRLKKHLGSKLSKWIHLWPAITCIVIPSVISIGNSGAYSLDLVKNDIEDEIVLSFRMNPEDVQVLAEQDRAIHFEIDGLVSERIDSENRIPKLSQYIQISGTRKPQIEYILNHTVSTCGNVEPCESVSIDSIPITISQPAILRDLRIIQLTISPVIWDPNTSCYRTITDATIRIKMGNPDSINVLHRRSTPKSIAFDDFYSSIIYNYIPRDDQRDGEPEKYVIVVPDSYESRIQGFIAWKEEQGFSIDIVKTSEIVPVSSPDALRTILLNLYASPSPPVYVLIIGDENTTPIYYSYDPSHPGDYADDLFFSLLAGEDFFPDVFLSRLPAESASELTIMLNKIMMYELNPQVSNLDFYTTALMSASALEDSQITAKEQTAERLETYCGYTNVHRYYEWDSFTTSEIIASINEGVSIINYRGEGWRRGWNPLHEYWFDDDDVYQLHNGYMTPFVTSVGCGVCLFNTTDDCFGHAFLAAGTATVPMGAACLIGPTWNTHTTFNNWLDRGMYRGYVYWEVYQSGPMMNYGKMYMMQQFPEPENQIYNEIHFRTYLCFGTPDLFIRTGIPLQPVIGLAYGNDSMNRFISVRDSAGLIVDHGIISFTADGTRWVYTPDENGGIATGLSTVSSNQIEIVASGKNIIPKHVILPWNTGSTGNLMITEIKPDIPTDGNQGDMLEIFNADTHDIDLNGWIASDLDGYDIPMVNQEVILSPEQLAVIVFVGPQGQESVTAEPYGVLIKSVSIPDFSSLEGVAVLRDPLGRICDSLAWHDNTNSASSNAAIDMSKITPSGSSIEVLDSGWWTGPNTITQETYELYAIDWSPFAGNDGVGSIQRASVGSPDGKSNYTIQNATGFGSYYHGLTNPAFTVQLQRK